MVSIGQFILAVVVAIRRILPATLPRGRVAAWSLPDGFPPECTHSTVRIFSNNVLPCPVVHQQNSRTTHRMNQLPLRTQHFLIATNENPLNFVTPSKQRAVAISNRYEWSHSAHSLIRNFFAPSSAFHLLSLVTHHR